MARALWLAGVLLWSLPAFGKDDEAPPSLYGDEIPETKLSRDDAVHLYACTLLPSCGQGLAQNLTGALRQYLADPKNKPDDVRRDGQAYHDQAKREYEERQRAQRQPPPPKPDDAPRGSAVATRDARTGEVAAAPPPSDAASLGGGAPPADGGAAGAASASGGAAAGRSAELDRALGEQKGLDGKYSVAAQAGSRLKNAFASLGEGGGSAPGDGGSAAARDDGGGPGAAKAALAARASPADDALNQRVAGEVRGQVPARKREALLADYAGAPGDPKFKDLAPTVYRGPLDDSGLNTFGFTRRCRPPEDCNKYASYPYAPGQLARAETLNKMPASTDAKATRKENAKTEDRKPRGGSKKLAELWAQIGARIAQSHAVAAPPEGAPKRTLGQSLSAILARLSGRSAGPAVEPVPAYQAAALPQSAGLSGTAPPGSVAGAAPERNASPANATPGPAPASRPSRGGGALAVALAVLAGAGLLFALRRPKY